MTNEELKTYYKNLLIAQYFDKPNARGSVGAVAEQGIADQIIASVQAAYDIDTATGAQLDIIGKYVGVERVINGLDITREYFAMPSYDDATPDAYAGFADYDDTAPDWYFRYYADDNTAYRLNDDEMRNLIKLFIRKNSSDGSLADIDDIVDTFFGADCAVTDGGDMTLVYAFTAGLTYTLPAIAAFTEALPHPAGVLVTYTGI